MALGAMRPANVRPMITSDRAYFAAAARLIEIEMNDWVSSSEVVTLSADLDSVIAAAMAAVTVVSVSSEGAFTVMSIVWEPKAPP